MLKKITLLTAIFFSTTIFVFAANDVQIVDITYFDFLTSDTAAATTITASAGGQVTNFDIQSDYIDVTLDNLSTVTFNVTAANNYFIIIKESASNDYTVTPNCPTTTVTLTGTGTQAILRLKVQTTSPGCTTTHPTGGSGAAIGYPGPSTQQSVQPQQPPSPSPSPFQTPECSRTISTPIPFIDITNNWAEEFINTLYRRCIIDGRELALFEPDENLTRAELVKIVLNTYKLGTAPFENLFTDVFENDWFAGYVINSAKRGIVSGYINQDGTSSFKPVKYISRAEALKVMLKAKGITDFSGYTANFADVKKGYWYYDYVAYAQAKGILVGYTETVLNADGTTESVTLFKPDNLISRAEISKIDLLVEKL